MHWLTMVFVHSELILYGWQDVNFQLLFSSWKNAEITTSFSIFWIQTTGRIAWRHPSDAMLVQSPTLCGGVGRDLARSSRLCPTLSTMTTPLHHQSPALLPAVLPDRLQPRGVLPKLSQQASAWRPPSLDGRGLVHVLLLQSSSFRSEEVGDLLL